MTFYNPRVFEETCTDSDDPQKGDFIVTGEGINAVGSDTWAGKTLKIKKLEVCADNNLATPQFTIKPLKSGCTFEIVKPKDASAEEYLSIQNNSILYSCATNSKKSITSNLNDMIAVLKETAADLIEIELNQSLTGEEKVVPMHQVALTDVIYENGTAGDIRYNNTGIFIYTNNAWHQIAFTN